MRNPQMDVSFTIPSPRPCMVPARTPALNVGTVYYGGWPAGTRYRATGRIDEQAKKARRDSGREMDEMAGRGRLAGRDRAGFPAVEQAHRRGEERCQRLAARRRGVDQGPGLAGALPVAQRLPRRRRL